MKRKQPAAAPAVNECPQCTTPGKCGRRDLSGARGPRCVGRADGLDNCDCLNTCGDDPWLAKGKAQPCARRAREEAAALHRVTAGPAEYASWFPINALGVTACDCIRPMVPVGSTCLKCGGIAVAGQAIKRSELCTALDLTLTKEEAEGLAAVIDAELESDDDTVRLMVGDGHSGYGLYAAHPEYPEEGAILVKNLPAPAGVTGTIPRFSIVLGKHGAINFPTKPDGEFVRWSDVERAILAAPGVKGNDRG